MKKVLFIGGSPNQTTIIHAVAKCLCQQYDCYFSPYFYDDDHKIFKLVDRLGFMDPVTLGKGFYRQALAYFKDHNLPLDAPPLNHHYDLVVMATDIYISNSLLNKKIILIQEGMTDPKNLRYYLIKWFNLPRYIAFNTSVNGLSDAYQYFCVASEGYRDHFIKNGVRPEKMVVTGIPNFDNVAQLSGDSFPHKNFVLVATSDIREIYRLHNRKKFIRQVCAIAGERPLIFKLHPNEVVDRAVREIKEVAPHALIYTSGDIEPMIVNCDVLITQYSTVAYIGLTLGKEVHSYFDVNHLNRLLPIQNGGSSAHNIAQVCHHVLENRPPKTDWQFDQ